MNIVDEVAKAIATSLKVVRRDADPNLFWGVLMEHERDAYREAAKRAIETYLSCVARI